MTCFRFNLLSSENGNRRTHMAKRTVRNTPRQEIKMIRDTRDVSRSKVNRSKGLERVLVNNHKRHLYCAFPKPKVGRSNTS